MPRAAIWRSCVVHDMAKRPDHFVRPCWLQFVPITPTDMLVITDDVQRLLDDDVARHLAIALIDPRLQVEPSGYA
jgi:hypothetical protein